MMRYIYILILVLTCATSIFAQGEHSLLLNAAAAPTSTIKGSTTGGVYILPDGGGTLLTSVSIGNIAWVLAGNALTGGTPATPVEFMGSTNNYDVVLKANNVEKLRLVSGGGLTATGGLTSSGATTLSALGLGIVHSSAVGVLSSSPVVLTSEVSGILPVSSGGTGNPSMTANAVLLGNGVGSISSVGPGAANTFFVTAAGAAPSWNSFNHDLTLLGNGIGTALGIDLAHANTWSATQSFSAGVTHSGATSPLTVNGSAGNNGDVLKSNGAGATPSWVSPASLGIVNACGGAVVNTITMFTSATTICNSPLTVTGANVAGSGTLTAATGLVATTGGLTVSAGGINNTGGMTSSGATTLSALGLGIVHSSAAGLLSSSPVLLTSEVSGLLPVANGGTGLNALAAGSLVYGSGGNPMNTLGIGGNGTVLTSNGTVPSWNALTTNASLTGNGTTGSFAINLSNTNNWAVNQNFAAGVSLTGATSPLSVGGAAGNNGDILKSGGAGATPSWVSAGSFAWVLGGNSAPSSNIFGTLSATDVDMRAGGTNQMTLRNTGGIEIPATTTAGVGAIFQNGGLLIHSIGGSNFFAGPNAGNLTTTGVGFNTGVGFGALGSNSTGFSNTSTGYNSLVQNTSGVQNTAAGAWALFTNSTGNYNTAMGLSALYNNTFDANSAFGSQALNSNTTGGYNTAVGYYALLNNTIGYSNTATGEHSMDGNVDGFFNTASGSYAMYNNNSGQYNTAIGGLYTLATNTSGTYNTAIGSYADVGSGNLTNATAIGANAVVNQSNSLVLGNGANVGIGQSAPTQKLEVTDGNILLSNTGTAGEMRFAEPGGTNYTAFKAQTHTAGSVTYTLPAADGTNGQTLATDGSGTLFWQGTSTNRFRSSVGTWLEHNISQGSANIVMDVDHQPNHTDVVQAFSGSIVGVTIGSDVPVTTGSISVEVLINGVGTGFFATITAGGGGGTDQYNSATQAAGITTFNANDRIGMRYSSSNPLVPNNGCHITCTPIVQY
ncbi:MAG TPA: hypothetical protein VFO76_06050 [Candidatus Kapabacteria bacterium]|nr:hypothetical protein [Candidatus Kapabacteria bacterium]